MGLKDDDDNKKNIWYFSTDINNHMHGSLFVDIDETVSGHVIFGNFSKILGRGKVLICLKNYENKFISDMYYVPNIKTNILNMGQIWKLVAFS